MLSFYGENEFTLILSKIQYPFNGEDFIALLESYCFNLKSKGELSCWMRELLSSKAIPNFEVNLIPEEENNDFIEKFEVIENSLISKKGGVNRINFGGINSYGNVSYKTSQFIGCSETVDINDFRGKKSPEGILLDYDDSGYYNFTFDLKSLNFYGLNLHIIEPPKNRLNIYFSLYKEILSGNFKPEDFLEICLKNLENEGSLIILKSVLKKCLLLLKSSYFTRNFEFCLSDRFLKLLIAKCDQDVVYYTFYLKRIAEFSILPEHLQELETLYEKHFDQNFQEKHFKLLARIISSQKLNQDKREFYISEFLNHIPVDSKKKYKSAFKGALPDFEKKFSSWLKIVSNIRNYNEIKYSIKVFNQPNQDDLNEVFAEKFFKELKSIMIHFDSNSIIAKKFVKYLFPLKIGQTFISNKINEILENNEMHWILTEKKILNQSLINLKPKYYRHLSVFRINN